MIPILTDNARMLASAYRNLSAAQKESRTEVVQQGVTLTLSSWRDGRIYRNALIISYRDDTHHDRYDIEIRDISAMAIVDGKLVVQTDGVELKFDATDELPPSARPCPYPGPPYPF